jgi:site-specific DNA-cytosine methylase
MKVLVACEESQAVCKAFRERGHEAFSCDIIECSGGHPEWHIHGDVLKVLNPKQISSSFYGIVFKTMDGTAHRVDGKWDLIIAHPPCTRLCSSGQRWLYWGDMEYKALKLAEQRAAIVFFMRIALADCDKIVIENPSGVMSACYRKPDCTYNPYDFEGETECKKTCLWLKNVPPLKPTRKIPLPREQRTQGIWKAHFGEKKLAWNDPETARLRSQTPIGVAKAMAEQWG